MIRLKQTFSLIVNCSPVHNFFEFKLHSQFEQPGVSQHGIPDPRLHSVTGLSGIQYTVTMSCTCAPSSAAAGRPPAPPAGCWGSRPGSRTGWPACPGCGRTASHQKQRNWSASGNNSTPFFFAVFNFKWFQN